MFGLENITNNDGWAMAVVGASIVFMGLVVLSFVISQIHRLLNLWEDREKVISRFKQKPAAVKAPEKAEIVYGDQRLPSVEQLINAYKPLIEKLQEPFKLSQVFEIAKNNDMPHPHLSIQRLQEADVLVAQGDGTFTWNESIE
ncbi:MAG: OadG family protein [Deltaproteobacteria bacterium]|nr:OadG family protein [Deltaproteobacteria bacterium]MBW2517981.1 OadG family protein [Deltaproteobacteria bacterium]